jgi:hypothetical protein
MQVCSNIREKVGAAVLQSLKEVKVGKEVREVHKVRLDYDKDLVIIHITREGTSVHEKRVDDMIIFAF